MKAEAEMQISGVSGFHGGCFSQENQMGYEKRRAQIQDLLDAWPVVVPWQEDSGKKLLI